MCIRDSYAALREANPRLVYCSISAYGQSGPRAQEGGFDLTIQAMSGLMSVTGEAGGEPVKCGVPVADFSAGLYGAFAIASALRAAQASGQGTHIDVPTLGATLGIAALQTSEFFGSGRDPVKLGSACLLYTSTLPGSLGIDLAQAAPGGKGPPPICGRPRIHVINTPL